MTYQIETHIAKRLQDFFSQFDFIDKVEVFGSRARHDCSTKSDIDLCIYSLEMSAKQFTKLKIVLDELPILYKVDIVHFEESNDALKENILRDGKLFYTPMVKLIDICEPKQHKTIAKSSFISDGKYLIYGANGVIGRYNSYTHTIKTLLITCRGATCGTLNISEPMSYINGNAMALNNLSEKVDLNYLYYSLNERGFNDVITGSAQPQITKENLEKIKIYLPSLTKQKQIAKRLDKAKELIELRQDSISKLDELSKSIFIDMFGDPVLNPMGWKINKLSEFGNCKNGLNFNSKINEYRIKCLGVGDFKNLTTVRDIESLQTISIDKKPTKEFLLQNADIIFVRSNGSKNLVGRCIEVYPNEKEVTFSGFCIRFRLSNDLILVPYLLHVLKSNSIRKNMAGRGANIQNINQQILLGLNIPLPPLNIQEKFSNIIQKIEQQKSLYQEQLKKLQENFDSLLSESFSV